MYDALIQSLDIADKSDILNKLKLTSKDYLLATLHRPANTDNKENLTNIIEAFSEFEKKIVFPIHPRTEKTIKQFNLQKKISDNIIITKPVGYLDFLCLQKNAVKILTDSGGIQKEAYLLKIPCITLRDKTEWVETVEDGWNILVGADKEKIIENVNSFNPSNTQNNHFGKGNASKKIREFLEENM